MCDPADFKDAKTRGTNPCGEQSLESYELCCLRNLSQQRQSLWMITCVRLNLLIYWAKQLPWSTPPGLKPTGFKKETEGLEPP